jgi:uncharacterized protein YtpQ (UPF0354 family)
VLVDRNAVAERQEANDVLMAAQTLKCAFTTDVVPILARARERKGAAIDPIGYIDEAAIALTARIAARQPEGTRSGIVRVSRLLRVTQHWPSRSEGGMSVLRSVSGRVWMSL